MKFKHLICLLVGLTLFVVCVSFCVFASDSGSVSTSLTSDFDEAAIGSSFTVDFSITPNFSDNISAFSIDLSFPSNKLSFSSITNNYNFSSSELQCYQTGNTIKILYLTENSGFSVTEGIESDILSINFNVNDTSYGDCNITAKTYGIVTDSLNNIAITDENSNLCMQLCAYVPTDCRLSSLSSSIGSLSPDFNGDITTYDLDVPSDTNQVILSAEAIDPTTTVKVARKTLYKAGTTTPITVTVKASSGDSLDYLVNVNRASQSDSDIAATSKASTSSKSSSSSKASTTSSNKSNGTSSNSSNDSSVLGLTRSPLSTNSNNFWIYILVLALLIAGAGGTVIWNNKRTAKKNLTKEDIDVIDDDHTDEN